jgi:hypothetical protein
VRERVEGREKLGDAALERLPELAHCLLGIHGCDREAVTELIPNLAPCARKKKLRPPALVTMHLSCNVTYISDPSTDRATVVIVGRFSGCRFARVRIRLPEDLDLVLWRRIWIWYVSPGKDSG